MAGSAASASEPGSLLCGGWPRSLIATGGGVGCCAGAAGAGGGEGWCRSARSARFRRDQRRRKFCEPVIPLLPTATRPASAPWRPRLAAVALALEELALAMVFGDEGLNRLGDRSRHRHGLDQVAARLRIGLALGRIGRDRCHLVG